MSVRQLCTFNPAARFQTFEARGGKEKRYENQAKHSKIPCDIWVVGQNNQLGLKLFLTIFWGIDR
jgi:hypothetical protein